MLRAADVLAEVRDGAEFGISDGDLQFDIAGAAKHRDKVVKTLTGGVASLMKKHKIDVLQGTAALAGKGKITVDGKEVETKNVVIATGSVPLPIPGTTFGGRVLDTEGMWTLNEQPRDSRWVGAGASGTEAASAFGRYGTEVVLIEMVDRILPLEDPDISKVVAAALRKQNVKVVTGARVEGVKASARSVELDSARARSSSTTCASPRAGAPDVEGPRPRRRRREDGRPRDDRDRRAHADLGRRRVGDR